ncbi:MAG: hypothetical protein WD049_01335 [Candidatus Paceibacterota bacterium]
MVLSTHSVIGATTATILTRDPALGFLVGVASHFLLDMVPHWDYTLASKRDPGTDDVQHKTMVFGRAFLFDCVKMGFDFGLGIAVVSVLAFSEPSVAWVLVAGLWGGVLPDILQFCYFRAPRVFGWAQMIHESVHSRFEIVRATDGIFAQALLSLAAVMIWAGGI